MCKTPILKLFELVRGDAVNNLVLTAYFVCATSHVI